MDKIVDITKDIVDKYTTEQIIAYLDRLSAGVLKNYQTAIKVNQPQILFGDLGDIAQMRSILHEINKRNQERERILPCRHADANAVAFFYHVIVRHGATNVT